jgi:hypothetical protein
MNPAWIPALISTAGVLIMLGIHVAEVREHGRRLAALEEWKEKTVAPKCEKHSTEIATLRARVGLGE